MANLFRCGGKPPVKIARIGSTIVHQFWLSFADVKKLKTDSFSNASAITIRKATSLTDAGTVLRALTNDDIILDLQSLITTYSINTTTYPYLCVYISANVYMNGVSVE